MKVNSVHLRIQTVGQKKVYLHITMASVSSVHLTHLPSFFSMEDFTIITETTEQLERSGFYWGALTVQDAHRMLKAALIGSYLIRDSQQKDVFFTLSYRAKDEPISVRIDYKQQRFSLAGAERSFHTIFALLEHYINLPKRSLRVPYRQREPSLQELCRSRVMGLCSGKDKISDLPVTHQVQDFLSEFPYNL